ncbi:alpha/beta fold hydrolase [Aggregatilinea lenta]|uniref:alpha/beta fold hydrolase n=1 Tax=Aggregatilinea lenta TaxID=913108 RepID=UPI000E5BA6B6|nr:alpha/beta hydrolase [Aggregatilinea lenta]
MKVELNGTLLEVTEQGSGEIALFVHGSNSDYRTWHNQQAAFASQFRAVVYSRRYHYPNATIPDEADYAMADHLDDLHALIRWLGDDPVHLIGHSYGAFLGLLLAMYEPSRLRSLVLGEPPVFTLFISIPPKPQTLLKLFATRPRTAAAIIRFAATGLNPATAAAKRGGRETMLRSFGSAVLGPDTFNNLSEERLEQARINLFKAELLGSGFLPLDADAISRIQTPALLINGANSPALFNRFNDRLAALLPHAERVTIPAASHISHEDNPSAYNAAVLAFLEQHRAAPD